MQKCEDTVHRRKLSGILLLLLLLLLTGLLLDAF
jgi:hypothetical protein